eukprot:29943-Pelagococcus_subviridis.AAC.3
MARVRKSLVAGSAVKSAPCTQSLRKRYTESATNAFRFMSSKRPNASSRRHSLQTNHPTAITITSA